MERDVPAGKPAQNMSPSKAQQALRAERKPEPGVLEERLAEFGDHPVAGEIIRTQLM
jgi:hypothetical protein